MRERDYLDATNLVRIRLASSLVRVLVEGSKRTIADDEIACVLQGLLAWEHRIDVAMGTKDADEEPWLAAFPEFKLKTGAEAGEPD